MNNPNTERVCRDGALTDNEAKKMRPKHEIAAFDGWRVYHDGALMKIRVIPSPYRGETHVAIPGGKPKMQELEVGREFFREKDAACLKAKELSSEQIRRARVDLRRAEQRLQHALDIEGDADGLD
jgi:hypothetical protein